MKNKAFIVSITLTLMLTLGACQLAREDGGVEAASESDRLIGAFVTREYLDLFDFESYFNDNMSDIMKGGEINVDSGSGYNGRIYAALKPLTLTNEETGETIEDWEYVFEDLDGIPFFAATYNIPGRESYIGGHSDSAISDGHLTAGDRLELEGTIYMAPRNGMTFYVNPVYQSADGGVYVTTGQGISRSGDISEGEAFSQWLEETNTVTENGEKTESATKITIHIAVKYPTKLTRVIQMSAENTPISQVEYAPEKLPESIAVAGDAEYLIVETVKTSPDGDITERELLDSGVNSFTAYITRDDGICEGKFVQIIWE